MAFRIQRTDDTDDTLFFEGVMDGAALAALSSQVGPRARVVLRRGTEVEPGCLDELLGLGIEVVAETPFLARMLRDCRP